MPILALRVKKLTDTATLPTFGDPEAAGCDLYADLKGGEPIRIFSRQTVMIGTGIACEFPDNYFGLVLPRSSVGTKKHLRLANTAGVIDNSYRGEIMLAFTNTSDNDQFIEHGDRLAQMILLPYLHYQILEADELSETVRGAGGFGSTGK
ncbi:MAG: dUTP diphosphatase [Bacteroidaceae bacterium]|nr:dUTP diphosphatase [Bacteroidaceae bacterium]